MDMRASCGTEVRWLPSVKGLMVMIATLKLMQLEIGSQWILADKNYAQNHFRPIPCLIVFSALILQFDFSDLGQIF